MSGFAIHVERLAMTVQGLPEATVREAMAGLDSQIAALLAETSPTLPVTRELALVDAAPLEVPAGVDADSLRRLLAERVLSAVAAKPGGRG